MKPEGGIIYLFIIIIIIIRERERERERAGIRTSFHGSEVFNHFN